MDKYTFNIFAPCLLTIKYVSFTTSAIDKLKFSHSFRNKILANNSRAEMNVEVRLNNYREEGANWAILLKPLKLIRAIQEYHLTDYRLLFAMVTHLVLIFYLLTKVLFHIYMTGTNAELAEYHDRKCYFPRLFESHEKPDLFYGHTLVIFLYVLSIRLVSVYRLVKMSIINEPRYERVFITEINYGYLSCIYLSPLDWVRLIKQSVKHYLAILIMKDSSKLKMHLRFHSKIHDLTEFRYRDLIYYMNPIDFESCYKYEFPSLYKMEKKACGKVWTNSRFNNWHTTWPTHRIDYSELGLLAGFCATIFVLTIIGFFTVLICTLYFELDGTIREKFKTEWPFYDTINYLPTWLEEPRRLIRLNDLMIMTILQMPNQFDAVVYYTDVIMLISRAYKVMLCLEQDRIVCNTYMGSTNEYSGIILDPGREFKLDYREKTNLNRRVIDRIRLTQVLKAEFKDLKRNHTMYLNVMIFGCGFSIAYCISLILVSTSFSTSVAIGINLLAGMTPMILCMLLSAVLNNMFKGINKNLHLLVVNERSYLTKQTVKYLMIECAAFDSSGERSVQIAGTFSITPESLGPMDTSSQLEHYSHSRFGVL